jgi:high-affinity iron transporter
MAVSIAGQGGSSVTQVVSGHPHRFSKAARNAAVIAGLAVIVGVLIWQALTSHGNPDPTATGVNPTAAIMDTGILVFREGLEAILVLAALTASLTRTQDGYWKPVAAGAGLSFLATVATWFIVVALIADINAPALDIQAATGLLAIAVLLVIMNWFFHKIYWTGWITHHNRRKKDLMSTGERSRTAIFRGLALIGFTSVYREGFEVVLFLQSIRLKAGSHVILEGVLIGLALTAIVAMLTFVLHYRLPYRKMLIITGIMLGVVLTVMVGESVQECQQANWIGAHTVPINMPDWLNTWFAVFPTYESLISQAATIIFVVGSYYLARRMCNTHSAKAPALAPACIVPDCANCTISQKQ